MFKCIELLNTNNDKTVRSLAKYVFEAFRVHNLSVSWYVYVCIIYYHGYDLTEERERSRSLSPVAGCTRGCLCNIHDCRRWPEPMLTHCQLSTLRNKLQWNSNWNITPIILENTFENVVRKVVGLCPRVDELILKATTKTIWVNQSHSLRHWQCKKNKTKHSSNVCIFHRM